MGLFCLLHREGSAPAAYAADLFEPEEAFEISPAQSPSLRSALYQAPGCIIWQTPLGSCKQIQCETWLSSFKNIFMLLKTRPGDLVMPDPFG